MNVYPFVIDGIKYYFITNKQVTKASQNMAELASVTDELAKLYVDGGVYDYSFNLAPGTVLNADLTILYTPTVAYASNNVTVLSEAPRYKYVDGTYINIYKIGDRVLIGTKNSWDISRMCDLYTRNYSDLLAETLYVAKGASDELPEPGSYIFSNPKIHLLAKKYELHNIAELELAGPYDENYIKYAAGYYTEVVCDDLSKALKMLYMDRNKYHQNNNRLSLLSCILKAHCVRNEYNDYLIKNKCLNYYGWACVKFLLSLRGKLAKCNLDMFFGVPIPANINRSDCFKLEYLDFWNKVAPVALRRYRLPKI